MTAARKLQNANRWLKQNGHKKARTRKPKTLRDGHLFAEREPLSKGEGTQKGENAKSKGQNRFAVLSFSPRSAARSADVRRCA
jgi:hypothetical protein